MNKFTRNCRRAARVAILLFILLIVFAVFNMSYVIALVFACNMGHHHDSRLLDNSRCQKFAKSEPIHTIDSVVKLNRSMCDSWILVWRDQAKQKTQFQCKKRRNNTLLRLLNLTTGLLKEDSVFGNRFLAEHDSKHKKRKGKRKGKAANKDANTDSSIVINQLLKWKEFIRNINATTENPAKVKFLNDSLVPRMWVVQQGQLNAPPHITDDFALVDLVISVSISLTPSVEDHFFTLDSIFQAIRPSNQHKCLVLLFVTEIYNKEFVTTLVKELVKRYDVQIAMGLLEILVPKDAYYASIFPKSKAENLLLKNNDEEILVKVLRQKRRMDHVFMMSHAKMRGKYYLHLTEGTMIKHDFLHSIEKSVLSSNQSWTVMSFSNSSQMGQLFHGEDLAKIINQMGSSGFKKSLQEELQTFVRYSVNCSRAESYSETTREAPCLFQLKKTSLAPSNGHNKEPETLLDDDHHFRRPILKSISITKPLYLSTIPYTYDLLELITSSIDGKKGFLQLKDFSQNGRFDMMFKSPVKVISLRIELSVDGGPNSDLLRDTAVWMINSRSKMLIEVGNLTGKGMFDYSKKSRDAQHVSVLGMMFDGSLYRQKPVVIHKLIATLASQTSSNNMTLSSTATMSTADSARWAVPYKRLPRIEDGVLISY